MLRKVVIWWFALMRYISCLDLLKLVVTFIPVKIRHEKKQ